MRVQHRFIAEVVGAVTSPRGAEQRVRQLAVLDRGGLELHHAVHRLFGVHECDDRCADVYG